LGFEFIDELLLFDSFGLDFLIDELGNVLADKLVLLNGLELLKLCIIQGWSFFLSEEFVVEDVIESSSESMFLQSHLHDDAGSLENLDLVFIVGEGHVHEILGDLCGLFVFGLTIVAKFITNKILIGKCWKQDRFGLFLLGFSPSHDALSQLSRPTINQKLLC
jgi:hypothetical protein